MVAPPPGLSASAIPFRPTQPNLHPQPPSALPYDPATAHRDLFILTQLRDAILSGLHPHYPRPAHLGPPPPPPLPPPPQPPAPPQPQPQLEPHLHAAGGPLDPAGYVNGLAGLAGLGAVAVPMRKVERGAKRAKRRGKADWDGQDDVVGSLDYGETTNAAAVKLQPAVEAAADATSPAPAVPAKVEHSHSRSSRRQPPVGSAPPFALRDTPLFSDTALQPQASGSQGPPAAATPPVASSASASPAPAPNGAGGADGAGGRKETRGERKDREAREVQGKRAAAKAAKEAEEAAVAASAEAGPSTAPTVDLASLPVDSRARSRATKAAAAATLAVTQPPTPTIASTTKTSPVTGTRPLPAPYADPAMISTTRSGGRGGPTPPAGRMDGDFGYVAVAPEAEGGTTPFAVNGHGKGKKTKALKSKALGKLSPRMAAGALPLRGAPPPAPPPGGPAGMHDPPYAGYGGYAGGAPPPQAGYDPRFPPLPGPGYGYGPAPGEGHYPYGPPPVGDPYGYERGWSNMLTILDPRRHDNMSLTDTLHSSPGYPSQPSYPPHDPYYPPRKPRQPRPPSEPIPLTRAPFRTAPQHGYDPHYSHPPPPPHAYPPPPPPPQQHDAHGRWPGQPNYGKR